MLLLRVFLLITAYSVYYHSVIKKLEEDKFWSSALFIYTTIVILMTIIPDSFALNIQKNLFTYPYDNLKPYHDLLLNRSGSIKDIVINIVMMIPFAFLFMKVKKTTMLKTILITFALSLSIELSQLFLSNIFLNHRYFDITDLINNTVGGFLGTLLTKLKGVKFK